MLFEEVEQPNGIREAARQTVQAVNDYAGNVAGSDVSEKCLQTWALEVTAGLVGIVVARAAPTEARGHDGFRKVAADVELHFPGCQGTLRASLRLASVDGVLRHRDETSVPVRVVTRHRIVVHGPAGAKSVRASGSTRECSAAVCP